MDGCTEPSTGSEEAGVNPIERPAPGIVSAKERIVPAAVCTKVRRSLSRISCDELEEVLDSSSSRERL
jgi:hypothetical protein